MSWTASIHDPVNVIDHDITARLREVRASEQLGAESNSFRVSCKLIELVHKFHTITIQKGGVTRFAGYIINQTDSDKGVKMTEFECMDWTYVLSNRIVAKSFANNDTFLGQPDLIIKNMLTDGAPEITQTNIQAVSFSIESLQFPYNQLLECIAKVMDYLTDWFWYIDASKDFHLFNRYESTGVTFDNSTGSYNFLKKSLSVKYLGEKHMNRLWIIGAKQAAASYIDVYFTGDGSQRYFTLPYEPNYTDIYVGGVLKASLLESNDDGAQDFLINKSQKVVFIPDNIVTPFTGTIKVHFRPTIQVIDYYENAPSIATYGLYEKVIKNKDITDKLSARQFGRAEIKRKSVEKRIVNLQTFEDVKIGQQCPINIVEDNTKGKWDVVGNFLVRSVDTSISVVESQTFETRTVELEEII